MPTPDDNNPGTVTEPVVSQPPQPAPPPVAPPTPTVTNPGTTDWENSYKGLQKTYNVLFNDHEALKSKYEVLGAENEKNKQEIVRLTGELGTASTGLQTKDQELTKSKTEVESSKSQYQRLKLIAEKFPQLLIMEEQGLIPNMELKDLEPKLQAIANNISSSIDARARGSLQAAPPGSGGSQNNNIPPVESVEDIFEKLQVLAGSKRPEDVAEYNRLYTLYQELLDKPKE